MGLTQITTGGVDDNINIDSNTLKVDGSNNRVGIGTASPTTNLEINGGTENNIVRIVSTDANANIEFADNTTTSGCQIGANGDNLKFGISGTERMRIDSSGQLLVGVSSGGANLVIGNVSTPSYNRGAVAIKAVTDGNSIPANIYLEEASGAEGYTLSIDSDGDLNFHNSGAATPTVTFADSDRVGIGTASPSTPLHVKGGGDCYVTLEAGTTDGNAGLLIDNSAGTQKGFILYDTDDNRFTFGTSNSTRMSIDSSGNVGIGTSSPASKLTVADNGYSPIEIQSDRTSATDNIGGLHFKSATTNVAYIQSSVDGTLKFRNTSSLTERMRIDSSGNVGIGTSPTTPLQVHSSTTASTIRITNSTSGATSSDGLIIQENGNDAYIWNKENSFISFGTNNAERARLDSSGRLLIGTTSAGIPGGDELTIATSAHTGMTIRAGTSSRSSIYMSDGTGGNSEYRGYIEYDHGSDYMRFGSAAAERMRIDSSGLLGVGVSSPVAQVQINSHKNAETNKHQGGNYHLLLKNDQDDTGEAIGMAFSITSNATAVGAAILHERDGGGSQGSLQFLTNPGSDTIAERMRITSSGNVGIGTTSPGQQLTIKKTGGQTQVSLISDTTESGAIYFGDTASTNRGVVLYDHGQDSLQLYTSGGERARITSGGYFKSSNSGSYYSSSNAVHEFNQSGTNVNMLFRTTHANTAATQVQFGVNRAATSNYWFLQGISGLGSGNDTEFYIRGDGNAFADGSWSGGGADYAEYFEWSDGNTEAEDRRGISVVLDGDKIREAVDGEEPIGVISGNPSVVGDADVDRWKGKYLRDDYGSYVLDEDGYRQLNPDYDSDVEYVQRENRPEWDTVGLMGKLRIRKGQITGSRWIKMRDVSSSVEEWLVR